MKTNDTLQSFSNYQTQPIFLGAPNKIIMTSTLWEFTPQVSGLFQFSLELKDKDRYTEFDIDFSIWSDDESIQGIQTMEKGKQVTTVRLEKGVRYYIETVPNNDLESTITVSKYPFLELSKPVDVSLTNNQFAVLKFTPTQAANYRIFTGSFGGFGSLHGAQIELYSDEFLTQFISEGGEAYQGSVYAELNQYLEAGKTYIILNYHRIFTMILIYTLESRLFQVTTLLYC